MDKLDKRTEVNNSYQDVKSIDSRVNSEVREKGEIKDTSTKDVDIEKRIDNPEKNDAVSNIIKKLSEIKNNLDENNVSKTGVQFVEKAFKLNNKEYKGMFPVFPSVFKTELKNEDLKSSDEIQFTYCTKQLKQAIKENPKLAKKFNDVQLAMIEDEKPRIKGYTWHHNEETGVMELVDSSLHAKTPHVGGRAIWGGGKNERK